MNSFRALSAKLKIIFSLLVLAVAVLLVVLVLMFTKFNALSKPATANTPDVSRVVAAVSKVLLLPTGETPTLATVADPNVLKGQPFFANAQKGDDVLIYTNAKKAVLWRPSTGQVIEVSELNTVPSTASGNQ